MALPQDRSHSSLRRKAGSFPEQWPVIEPINNSQVIVSHCHLSAYSQTRSSIPVANKLMNSLMEK